MAEDEHERPRRRRATRRRRRPQTADPNREDNGEVAGGAKGSKPPPPPPPASLGKPTRAERHFAQGLRQHRRMALGATSTAVGLAVVGTQSTEAGSILVLLGLLSLMYAIHRYGRLGTAEERAQDA